MPTPNLQNKGQNNFSLLYPSDWTIFIVTRMSVILNYTKEQKHDPKSHFAKQRITTQRCISCQLNSHIQSTNQYIPSSSASLLPMMLSVNCLDLIPERVTCTLLHPDMANFTSFFSISLLTIAFLYFSFSYLFGFCLYIIYSYIY